MGLMLDIPSDDDDGVEGAAGAGGWLYEDHLGGTRHSVSCEISTDGINIIKEDLHVARNGIKDTKTGEFILNISSDEFDIKEKLGTGASGNVYKALHKPSGEYMALKSINVFDQAKRRQLVNDLKSLFGNQCPFLVKFYGAYYEEGNVKIALELMELGSLGSIIKNIMKYRKENKVDKSIPVIAEPILASIALQVLNGLSFLHLWDKSVHRDVKPDNILINRNGVVKLTDFGISKFLDETSILWNTFVGTMYYMSPERMDGEKYSYPGDIWALGIILIELATGRYPYPMCKNYIEMLNCVKSTEISSLINPKFSPDFKDFLTMWLWKDPEIRASALELWMHPWILENSLRDTPDIQEWAEELYQLL